VKVPPGASGGRYNPWIVADGSAQRLAGRLETSQNTVSDPAMGGQALLWQAEITTLKP